MMPGRCACVRVAESLTTGFAPLPPHSAALLNELLADPFLEESTKAAEGAAARSPTLVALKFAALRNLGGLLASKGEAHLVDALDAYCQAAALDSTDLVMWCVGLSAAASLWLRRAVVVGFSGTDSSGTLLCLQEPPRQRGGGAATARPRTPRAGGGVAGERQAPGAAGAAGGDVLGPARRALRRARRPPAPGRRAGTPPCHGSHVRGHSVLPLLCVRVHAPLTRPAFPICQCRPRETAEARAPSR